MPRTTTGSDLIAPWASYLPEQTREAQLGSVRERFAGGPARRADPRVTRRRGVIESEFPIPTGDASSPVASTGCSTSPARVPRGRSAVPRSSGSSRSRSSRPRAMRPSGAPVRWPRRRGSARARSAGSGGPLRWRPTGARRSSCSTDPLFITAGGGDRQRLTETIWWGHHEGSHSAEALRLGKQTLCQLSYSRSGSRSSTASA